MRKQVEKLIHDLIMDDGYTDYQSLPDDTKAILTAEMMSYEDDVSLFEPITESRKSEDNVFSLIVYMRSGSLDDAQELAETMKNNAIEYYAKRLEEKFDEMYGELECERKREAGLSPIVDRTNGEVRWIR